MDSMTMIVSVVAKNIFDIIQLVIMIKKKKTPWSGSWRYGSTVQTVSCTCGGYGFNSQHLHGNLKPSITWEGSSPSFGLHWHQQYFYCVQAKHLRNCVEGTHLNIIKAIYYKSMANILNGTEFKAFPLKSKKIRVFIFISYSVKFWDS